MSDAAKNFDILAISWSVLHNYFYGLIKLFLDLYLAKFLYFRKTILLYN